MRTKQFKNGTNQYTFDQNVRCVCGCGEGMHFLAGMAGKKCCDKCEGWKPAPKKAKEKQ